MNKPNNPPIKIDEEFKNLIRPLRQKEYLQLEENIRNDGCLEPIVLWNNTIIDGHNRYEICTRHNIPFNVRHVKFSCREEAIAWICKNQLGRRNISEETRRYLIGRQYESEKIVQRVKNPLGKNQYVADDTTSSHKVRYKESPSRHKTAQRIADENHVTHTTVQKYALFTKAIDEISQKEPELARKILSGNYKIAHQNIIELSLLPADELRKINRRVDKHNLPYMQYSKTRNVISNPDGYLPKPQVVVHTPSIKDMPEEGMYMEQLLIS